MIKDVRHIGPIEPPLEPPDIEQVDDGLIDPQRYVEWQREVLRREEIAKDKWKGLK